MEVTQKLKHRKQHDVDMTHGNVFTHLLMFALPLLAGNLFQQMYNMVDAWVVGNYVNDAAFSAVGTVTPIINMLIGSFTGLASGAGVVISQCYGAHEEERVSDAVHTSIVFTAILAVVFTVVGIFMTPFLLRLMSMPDDVFPEARAYLTIYFAGMAGLMFYNMGAGILRAVGDSRRPFYYLVVCAVINTILDLVLVIQCHMGEMGLGVHAVAIATIVAQAVSALLTMGTLMRANSCIRLVWSKMKLHLNLLKKIVAVGIPAALQMAVTAFSNVIVQSYIFGAEPACTGGWTAYTKVDQVLFLPMQSLGLAAQTFVGQNLGAGQPARAKKGTRMSLVMALTVTLVVSALVIWKAELLASFFVDADASPNVIQYGTMFLRNLTPFYVCCCFNQIYAAALRGAGDSKAPMVIMLVSFVLFRQVYLFIMSNFITTDLMAMAMGYPAGCLVCSILTLIYYRAVGLGKQNLMGVEHAEF